MPSPAHCRKFIPAIRYARAATAAPRADEISAEEIVSGTFRNIAGTIDSVDASSSTLSVHDLLSKKNSAGQNDAGFAASTIAARDGATDCCAVEGSGAGATQVQVRGCAGSGRLPAPARKLASSVARGARPRVGLAPAGSGAGGRSGGAPDFQQMLGRMPAATLADLHKGDAVIIVSTEGTAGAGTVITLVSGVEPILQAAPGAGRPYAYALEPGAPAGDAGGP